MCVQDLIEFYPIWDLEGGCDWGFVEPIHNLLYRTVEQGRGRGGVWKEDKG